VTALWRTALALWLLFSVGLAPAEVAVPPLHAHVTDLTGTLTAQQSSEMETLLSDFEARKGSQIAVLLVPTTQPENIEQYAIRVVEQWKLGRKHVDDGALLLVAKQDNVLRIEVGYGLEGVMPDAVSKRIISETIIPHFKQNDFPGGIRAGVDAMVKVAEGEPLPAVSKKTRQDSGSGDFLYILFFVLAIASFMRALLGLFGSLLAGSVAGVLAWLSFGSVIAGVVAGVLAILFSFGRGGGFIPGGFGGLGGGGGGGFSGGGGGFGGGGASGRW